MRLFFPNTTRPKKAAKHLAGRLGVSLSQAQRGVALACGYRGWHELEGALAAGPPSALDQDLAKKDFITRLARLTVTLAGALNVPDGDAQYALANARLTGDVTPDLVS